MNARVAKWTIALVSITAIATTAVVDMGRTSPGPLSAVHGREEDLVGKRSCSECHGGWLSSMASSCLDCHELIDQQLESGGGLHGAIDGELARKCATCHSEHHGEGFAIVNRQSFARAGIPDPEHFDHQLVRWEMDGEHLKLQCSECHPNADVQVLPKGELRFAGLDQDCSTCHEDAHDGRMALGCATCHGQTSWAGLHSRGHERVLPLIGAHGQVACRDCHAENGLFSLESMGMRKGRPQPRTCATCHESPHAEEFLRGVALAESKKVESACVVCHLAEHTSFRQEELSVSAAHHAASGFKLDAPHDQAECQACHDPDGSDFAARYPGRGPDLCGQCHLDPHGGQFKTGPFALRERIPAHIPLAAPEGGDCLACHERERFEPHSFGVEEHALASLALEGAHARTECDECHLDPALNQPRAFRGTPADCDRCHSDAHEGFFEPFVAGLPQPVNGACARCHGAESFSELPGEGFDHGRFTGFEVRGAHAAEQCEACHRPAEEPDERGRKFGRVKEHFGVYEGCVTCHEDPHAGKFDAAELPLLVDDRSDCARCHVEVSFRTLERGFDHGRWTGFALVGAHDVACKECHTPLRRPGEAGRTWDRAPGLDCADCHQNPHGRQFEIRGQTDCARCHVDEAASFLKFDHERDSRFRLGEQHKDVTCGACHMSVVEDSRRLVRYKPLGTQCADCHGVDEDVFLRRTPKGR